MKKFLLFFAAILLLPGTAFIANATSIVVPVHENPTNPTNPADAFKNAVKEFKSLSKAEQKVRIKEAKKVLKEQKKLKKAGAPETNTTLLVIVAILLPPLAVYLHEGEINSKFWLDLVLTLLFYIPGLIYALIVILKKD